MPAHKQTDFLDNAYRISTTDDARQFYDDWAQTYDDEISANGYITPVRCAHALAAHAGDPSAPILDIGCGTGISGLALRDVGFSLIDGSDLSQAMLDKAASKGIYRELWQADLQSPFPFSAGTYQHLAAIGVIATGHMPAETIARLADLLSTGGLLVFSLNDHTLEDPRCEATLNQLVDQGIVAIKHEDYGEHLPGIGLKSKVFVVIRI